MTVSDGVKSGDNGREVEDDEEDVLKLSLKGPLFAPTALSAERTRLELYLVVVSKFYHHV
jgi:hypothetical protein